MKRERVSSQTRMRVENKATSLSASSVLSVLSVSGTSKLEVIPGFVLLDNTYRYMDVCVSYRYY
jgi:hypothetical protein